MALSISFDHAQKRVDDDRISVYAGGADMEVGAGTSVWVDPITKTLMIMPSCLKGSWYTSNSGDYAKLGMSAFGLSSTDWEDRQDQHATGPWISRKDSATNGTAITSHPMPRTGAFGFLGSVTARGTCSCNFDAVGTRRQPSAAASV